VNKTEKIWLMKNIQISLSLVVAFAVLATQVSSEQLRNEDVLNAEAKAVVQQFAGRLKPTLKAAIQSGGLVHAIDVCATEAPAIAAAVSAQTGWSIKRVSLKARNNSSAVPDEFERDILTQFDERQRRGESASEINHSRLADDEFRFMSAQGVEGLCLNCHGVALQPDVKQAIGARYPDDEATGYSLGQIRGAFSVSKRL